MFRSLLKKYLAGKTSPEETGTIEKWYASADNTPVQQPDDLDSVREHIYRKTIAELKQTARIVPFYKTLLFRSAAAACVLLLAGAGAWFMSHPNKAESNQIMAVNKDIPVKVDIPSPTSVHAVLTLADGTEIRLDSAANGSLAVQTSAQIVKDTEGFITYKPLRGKNAKTEFNVLSVPRGSRIISLTLSDGSLVVLNAESSIRYPVVFNGNSREVSIEGEVYFSVSRNESLPFLVKHNDVTIKVLGTEFNVNSYADEKNIAVTLLEGAVQVSQGSSLKLLKPGQQANLGNNNEISIENNVDVDEVVAWKSGRFQFGEKADIASIMRQISRWYDVEVEFKGKINEQFWGSMRRTANVSQVLEMLEETGRVKFKIDHKKIIVMPTTK
jgi:ferric-dicitrate binding protein FerR (iron transport regulator)